MSSRVVTGRMRFAERKDFDKLGREVEKTFSFSEAGILRPALYSFCPDQTR